jgi:hypothetical protein
MTAKGVSRMYCLKCGGLIDTSAGPHRCAYVMNLEAGSIAITGQPIGLVVEGPPDVPAGRRVDARPASGGRAFSRTDSEGGFEIELSGVLARGRDNEGHALETLVEALRAVGREAFRTNDGQDDRGEDGVIEIKGKRCVVQVVSVPVAPILWRQLAAIGRVQAKGTVDDAVSMLREALEHKRGKAIGTILVLDAAHFGASIGPSLVEAYNAHHGDPEREFSLAEAWLVGPTARSTFRLG